MEAQVIYDAQSKTVIVPKWVADVIKPILSFLLEQVVEKIEVKDIQKASRGAVEALLNTITVLADDNPQNGDQVVKVWLGFINDDILVLASSRYDEAVAKIEDENLRNLLAVIKQPLLTTVAVLTDTLGDNGDQIKDTWRYFVKNTENREVILVSGVRPLLLKAIKNDTIVDATLAVIRFWLSQVIW